MLGVWYGDCELYDKALEMQNQLFFILLVLKILLLPIITLDIFMV